MAVEQRKLTMKDLPLYERPYEKLEKLGEEMLSNSELLAIIIKTGNKKESSLDLANRILSCDDRDIGLSFLYELTLQQLREIDGIGKVKAIQIKALSELSKRMAASFNIHRKKAMTSPKEVCDLVMEEMRILKKEVFKAILLDVKNHVIKQLNISVGSLNSSIVHPREVFCEAVKVSSSGIIFVHNHPSGDPEPSREDIDTTERLIQAGNILGIKVLDHIIIGDGKYVSLKEKGYI